MALKLLYLVNIEHLWSLENNSWFSLAIIRPNLCNKHMYTYNNIYNMWQFLDWLKVGVLWIHQCQMMSQSVVQELDQQLSCAVRRHSGYEAHSGRQFQVLPGKALSRRHLEASLGHDELKGEASAPGRLQLPSNVLTFAALFCSVLLSMSHGWSQVVIILKSGNKLVVLKVLLFSTANT